MKIFALLLSLFLTVPAWATDPVPIVLTIAPGVDGVTSMLIERSVDGGPFKFLVILTLPEYVYRDSDIGSGHSYAYRCFSRKGDSWSVASAPDTLTIPGENVNPSTISAQRP